MKRKATKKKDIILVRCRNCKFCKPITTVPNLDYKREPFLNTCDKQPYERMMDHDYECRFFEEAIQ
ncbi:MAG: hypothetical protein IJ749_01970 [Eubacterium sp.]|nr:hypothetical protein [Eubacterium sp.]